MIILFSLIGQIKTKLRRWLTGGSQLQRLETISCEHPSPSAHNNFKGGVIVSCFFWGIRWVVMFWLRIWKNRRSMIDVGNVVANKSCAFRSYHIKQWFRDLSMFYWARSRWSRANLYFLLTYLRDVNSILLINVFKKCLYDLIFIRCTIHV